MWRLLLISAFLAPRFFSFAAHILTLAGNTSLALAPLNTTSPALEAPEALFNLTYSPWPKTPIIIAISGPGLLFLDLTLFIGDVRPFKTSPMVKIPELQHFIQEFAENMRQEYPIPGFAPRHAQQSTVDVLSYTRWSITMHEGPFHGRLPTAAALAALSELVGQLGRYGPANIYWAIRRGQSRSPWAFGGLFLEIIEGVSLDKSPSNENGGFQTA